MTESLLPASASPSPDALAQLAEGERGIARIAGIFDDAQRAKVFAGRLARDSEVNPEAIQVLGPADASSLGWWQVRRTWRHSLLDELPESEQLQRHASVDLRVWGAITGAVLAGLIAWAATLMDSLASASDVLQALVLGALWGAMLGALLVTLWQFDPRAKRFERALRQALRSGSHAVVVYRVPAPAQALVLRLVRTGSDRWCAEAPRARRVLRTVDVPTPRRRARRLRAMGGADPTSG